MLEMYPIVGFLRSLLLCTAIEVFNVHLYLIFYIVFDYCSKNNAK